MAPPSAARLQALAKASCDIFSTTFNPTASRNGNKILRQRLRGPALLDYYPTESVKLQTVVRAFPELGLVDEAEEIRKSDVDARKRRKVKISSSLIRTDISQVGRDLHPRVKAGEPQRERNGRLIGSPEEDQFTLRCLRRWCWAGVPCLPELSCAFDGRWVLLSDLHGSVQRHCIQTISRTEFGPGHQSTHFMIAGFTLLA